MFCYVLGEANLGEEAAPDPRGDVPAENVNRFLRNVMCR